MSGNKYRPMVIVISEDDANREIAIGFRLDSRVSFRRLDIRPESGGWPKAREDMSDYFPELARNDNLYLLVLIDSDERAKRFAEFRELIPQNLDDRVFIFGAWTEAEGLIKVFGTPSMQKIGSQLAESCAASDDSIWQNNEFEHALSELDKMKRHLRPLLFQ